MYVIYTFILGEKSIKYKLKREWNLIKNHILFLNMEEHHTINVMLKLENQYKSKMIGISHIPHSIIKIIIVVIKFRL